MLTRDGIRTYAKRPLSSRIKKQKSKMTTTSLRSIKTLPSAFFAIALTIVSALSAANAHGQATEPAEPENEATREAPMTQSRLADIVKNLVDETQGSGNVLAFNYEGVNITMVSDAAANRMRLIAPVIEADKLTEQQVAATLVSNYHLALDARYAIGDGVLVSTFIHPLAELTRSQLLSAIRQVANLKKTFGTTYSSGELSYGVQQQPQEELIDI